ncbi:prenyltransferase/squalene oxidase repeat-containing protein [Gandjariella thermophila]|uniref:prenyltransferase/squalene oxidase repeat-containing protein n=1 Tax=Gandjariella thermophila TaxID=1931992 RepID=UPI001CEF7E31|nr:prenyltransferase/squalene oxidase repeat-containing protein [Gandjariella thermophila]
MRRGLAALFEWLRRGHRVPVPDTVAAEFIVPALIDEINAALAGLIPERVSGLDAFHGARLPLPRGMRAEPLARLRKAVGGGAAPPTKLWHSLEVVGVQAREAAGVRPVLGAVACSPAATAAWLGNPPPAKSDATARYLLAVQGRHGGPVPVGTPVAFFERAWVCAALLGAGLTVPVPRAVLDGLHAGFGRLGAPAGPGLPPDADDTATALLALVQVGSPRSPECLFAYQQPTHFACFPAERTPSTSTNAHVLEAFGATLGLRSLPGGQPVPRDRYRAAIGTISAWLADHQEPEGRWRDKWHASAYYATVRCATALARYGTPASAGAVRRAVRWVLDTQHPDGSWGQWGGTSEETAYAVQTLLLAWPRARDAASRQALAHAAARGCAFLLRGADLRVHPALWHDKDLYLPVRVVRAEVLAALSLARTRSRVRAMVDRVRTEQPAISGEQ